MKNNIITIQLPNTDRFNIPVDKDIDITQVGEAGGNPTKYFHDHFLAYRPELFQYSGEEIRRSVIVKIEWHESKNGY